MKNWNYINGAEVGNELTSYEKAKKSDLEKRLRKEEQLLADAKKMLGRKMSDDDRIGFEMQKEECEKNVSRLKEELRKIGNSKTNNTSSFVESAKRHMGENKTKADAEYWQYVIDKLKKDDPEERSFVATAKRELEKTKANLAKVGNSTEKLFYGLSKDAEKEEEKSDEALDDLKKTGNATPNYRYKGFLITNPEGEYVVFLQDGIHVAFRGTRSKAMAEDWCDWHDPKTGKVLNSKVGNAIGGLGLKKGDTVKVKSGMWSGEKGKVTGIHVSAKDQTLEVEVKLDNGGYVVDDQKQFVKVGNSTYDMTDRDYENEYKSLVQKRNNLQKGTKEYEEVQKRLAEIRKKIGRSPFGNSASDDKFAYVMREFEEGKLKTPDGKVVTDPAQAKAIAYSESKKTENGLARARNAMACNKEITLWNGNDTALVKADGTVLYLESNSFETGRDKFDSQELAVKELAKNGYKSK